MYSRIVALPFLSLFISWTASICSTFPQRSCFWDHSCWALLWTLSSICVFYPVTIDTKCSDEKSCFCCLWMVQVAERSMWSRVSPQLSWPPCPLRNACGEGFIHTFHLQQQQMQRRGTFVNIVWHLNKKEVKGCLTGRLFMVTCWKIYIYIFSWQPISLAKINSPLLGEGLRQGQWWPESKKMLSFGKRSYCSKWLLQPPDSCCSLVEEKVRILSLPLATRPCPKSCHEARSGMGQGVRFTVFPGTVKLWVQRDNWNMEQHPDAGCQPVRKVYEKHFSLVLRALASWLPSGGTCSSSWQDLGDGVSRGGQAEVWVLAFTCVQTMADDLSVGRAHTYKDCGKCDGKKNSLRKTLCPCGNAKDRKWIKLVLKKIAGSDLFSNVKGDLRKSCAFSSSLVML